MNIIVCNESFGYKWEKVIEKSTNNEVDNSDISVVKVEGQDSFDMDAADNIEEGGLDDEEKEEVKENGVANQDVTETNNNNKGKY